MSDSSPEIELEDAVLEFDDKSEVSSIVKTASDIGKAQWTLGRSDDKQAPDITCTFESDDEMGVTKGARAVGHGPRPLLDSANTDAEDEANVVVQIVIG